MIPKLRILIACAVMLVGLTHCATAPKDSEADAGMEYTTTPDGLPEVPAPVEPEPVVASEPPAPVSMPPLARRIAIQPPPPTYPPNREDYQDPGENPFHTVTVTPLSTFAVDVDTASYSNIRRFLTHGSLPPADAVRTEEMVNYFAYDYDPPKDDAPFAVHTEVAPCPWQPDHRLLRVGLKGRELDLEDRPDSNLVFLVDVSGSMQADNKLPLLKTAMTLLVDRLGPRDTVAMVTYASQAGVALAPTACTEANKGVILKTLDALQAGGSTHGSAGIQTAYDLATDHFIDGGTNRVILATDGDFNVGTTSRDALEDLIQEQAASGVFLTALGFGMGNYKDATLETLADKGNGNYGYIDTINEARRMLAQQLAGTLVTIAKDVKIQVEFNPAVVRSYRLLGYENRMLAAEDFNEDTKDAGEIGAGHTVTALYELVPAGVGSDEAPDVDPLRYQAPHAPTDRALRNELGTVKLRHKAPDSNESQLMTVVVKDEGRSLKETSGDFAFAASVTEFGLILREDDHAANVRMGSVLRQARRGLGEDPDGFRAEFVELVQTAKRLRNE